MKDLKISKQKLKVLHERLPHGAITRISKRLDCSRMHINNVLKGRYYNEIIIKEAIKEIENKRAEEERLASLIDNAL